MSIVHVQDLNAGYEEVFCKSRAESTNIGQVVGFIKRN